MYLIFKYQVYYLIKFWTRYYNMFIISHKLLQKNIPDCIIVVYIKHTNEAH